MSVNADFFNRDLVSLRDLNRKDIEYIMEVAEGMIPYAKGEKVSHPLDGKIVGNLFFGNNASSYFSAKRRKRIKYIKVICKTVIILGSCLPV